MNRKKRNRRQDRRRNPRPAPVPPSPPASPWVVTFEDTFSEHELNLDRWETQYPWGRDRSNVGELQWYGEDAFVKSTAGMILQATEGGPAGFPYTSGIITTHKSFSQVYGKFEIRCRMPTGKGVWPAFWLLPVDTSWPPEIDVIEVIGNDPTVAHMTYHYMDGTTQRSQGREWRGPDLSVDFHTYTVEWNPDSLVWYIDGVERNRVGIVTPRIPMYMLANLAVGGNWPGAPDANTKFPADFDIDYIRAWKRVS